MAIRYTVFLTPSFRRDLERLPAQAQEKVLKAIGRLEVDPFGPQPKIKKLKGKSGGQWRLEVWPYRLRYDVTGQKVVLYRVRHRKEIYES